MIIKGIFRRYERWNPVHPTYGAFWGVGVGIGCGVGWGPGFGPEVIGYVGAGCGAGFSVGFTLLGLGVGLPANYVFALPHGAFRVTRSALDDVQGRFGNRRYGEGWGDVGSHFLTVNQNPFAPFPCPRIENFREKLVDLPDYMKTKLVPRAKNISECLQRVTGHFFPWDRGGPRN